MNGIANNHSQWGYPYQERQRSRLLSDWNVGNKLQSKAISGEIIGPKDESSIV